MEQKNLTKDPLYITNLSNWLPEFILKSSVMFILEQNETLISSPNMQRNIMKRITSITESTLVKHNNANVNYDDGFKYAKQVITCEITRAQMQAESEYELSVIFAELFLMAVQLKVTELDTTVSNNLVQFINKHFEATSVEYRN